MHLGDFVVRHLQAGTFYLDGGAMFGVVPKTLWEKKSPPDERNRIKLAANVLLVRAADKNILIETGNGAKWDAKLRQIYGIPEGDGLQTALAQAGVKSKDIDIVINTHLHFDHAGGNTIPSGDRDTPAFPHAKYIVQREELEHAQHPGERDRASYFPDRFGPISAAGQWQLVDGDVEIVPGISVTRIPGHNLTIQAVKLTSGTRTLFFAADLFPTRHHLYHGSWPTTYIPCRRWKRSESGWAKSSGRSGFSCLDTIPTTERRGCTNATARLNLSRWTSTGSFSGENGDGN